MSCLIGTCTRKTPCRCALVRWTDINSYDGSWMGLEEAKALKPAPMETLGWIIQETEEYIVIASTLDGQDDVVGNVNAIPSSVISEVLVGPGDARTGDFRCLGTPSM